MVSEAIFIFFLVCLCQVAGIGGLNGKFWLLKF
uniref:Uncharacterized protein n=1 Tax=Rhizophora mucronata TaxID=61149 RepID=A0A2P2N6W8_RHIMU